MIPQRYTLHTQMMRHSSPQLSVLPEDAVKLTHFVKSPVEVAASWPAEQPLIALVAGTGTSAWSRWSIIAPATGKRLTLHAREDLQALNNAIEAMEHPSLLPGWIGYLGYELGKSFEPHLGAVSSRLDGWPLGDLIWCERALVHDALDNSWWSVGGLMPPKSSANQGDMHCGELFDELGDEAFTEAVDRARQYIFDGDIFQANITRRFTATVSGDVRSKAIRTLASPGGLFGAWIEFDSDNPRYLLSLSPELFLQYDSETRCVVTRPMKGTRPITDAPDDLLESEKDAAELHMIVDLMRNDLGRVCEFGTVQVIEPRTIERHPTVWQCTGEVQGKLRLGTTIYGLLKATFPAGSITGAPKIRAMQIIDALEPTPRGPYCGSIGIIGGSMLLNVAIRTAAFHGTGTSRQFEGTLAYGTGCGIVADSQLEEECRESHVKTDVLRRSPLFMQKLETARVVESQLLE